MGGGRWVGSGRFIGACKSFSFQVSSREQVSIDTFLRSDQKFCAKTM